MNEYRWVLDNENLRRRFQSLTDRRMELVLARLRFIGDYRRNVKAKFSGLRDKTDEKFVELAIDAEATHLLSYDDDLLSLMSAHTDVAERFRHRLPRIEVLRPDEFLARYRAEVKTRPE